MEFAVEIDIKHIKSELDDNNEDYCIENYNVTEGVYVKTETCDDEVLYNIDNSQTNIILEEIDLKPEVVIKEKSANAEKSIKTIKNSHFCCDYCNKQFKLRGSLICHIRVHTQERPFHCDICPMSSKEKGALNRHRKIHFPKPVHTRIQCQYCHSSFTRTDNLRNHVKEKHDPNPKTKKWSCHLCTNKNYSYKSQLLEHMRVHNKITICDICSKNFRNTSSLLTHKVKVHNSVPNCRVCNQSFDNYELYKKHVKVHNKFHCDLCGKTFSGSYHLKEHKNGHHFKIKSHKCDICHMSFIHAKQLYEHKKSHIK